MWNDGGDDYHERDTSSHRLVDGSLTIRGLMRYGCFPVVQQHQRWTAPEDSDVPEFTIEAAYKTVDHIGNTVTPGWRYILKWMESGVFKQTRDYGFIDRDAAVQAAKYEARNIARSLAPVHVETYTPEV